MTKSGNFHYDAGLSDKHKRIQKEVENSRYPMTPLEISSKTGISKSTVRSYLRDLEGWTLVRRKCRGYYISVRNLVTPDGCMVSGTGDIRVHSLRFRVVGVSVSPRSWGRDFGVLKLKFVAHRNGTAQVFVNCDKNVSLDYVAFRFLVEVVLRELGCVDWDCVKISSYEFNHDFMGVRLDGVQAVTLKSFDGSFRRAYNKTFGMRDEVRAVGSLRVEDVLALLGGGVSQYNVLQLLFKNFQKLDEYVEATKFQNRLVSKVVSRFSRLTDALMRFRE